MLPNNTKLKGLKSGLGRKIIIYILMFSSLITILGTALGLYVAYNQDIEAIQDTLDQVESSYIQSINSSLWVLNIKQVNLQLDGILRLPYMQYIEVEQNGNLLTSVGTPQKESIIQRDFLLSHNNFNNENIPLGVLRVTASLTGIYNRLKNQFSITFSTETVKIFLVAAFIFFLFYTLVGKHLIFMADYTQHLDLKHLGTPLKLQRKPLKNSDELEQLAQSINIMRTNLAYDIKERQKSELELERLNEALTLKNKELEQVVYVTSHDLRSPLVNVQGFSKELDIDLGEIKRLLQAENIPAPVKDQITPIIQEDIPKSLKFILSSVSKMDMLLTGLLKLSRLGRANLDIRPIDMNELVADVASTAEFQMKEANISIELGTLPDCLGDATQINQVFSNLLINAIKYTNPDRQGEIQISGKAEDGSSVYSIKDNGLGIAQYHQQKVFEIFHQLSPKKSEGEGLGLNIIKKIIDLHRGKIWLESEVGKGSTFFVSFQSVNSNSNNK